MPTKRPSLWEIHWVQFDAIVEPPPPLVPEAPLPRDLSSSAPLALLCPVAQGYALLAGLGASARARLAGDGRQRCLIAPAVVAAERNALRMLDAAARRHDAHAQVELVVRLARLGVPGRQIAELLSIDVSRACRLGRLAEAHPALREAVFSKRLSPGHARPLLKLPQSEQAHWVHRAATEKLSVSAVNAAVAGERLRASSTADSNAYASRIGEVLGSNVEIVSRQGRGGELRIDWFTIEGLKPLLRRLGDGPKPPGDCASPELRRTLRIRFQDPDELEHLLSAISSDP